MHFVTLRCGILTLKTSDSFFRNFRFLRQNGAFSATEQNQIYKNSLFLEGEIQFGSYFFSDENPDFIWSQKTEKQKLYIAYNVMAEQVKMPDRHFSTPRLSSQCILYIISAFCLFSFLNQDESSKAIFFI